jgi:hypothetical protein
MLIVGVFLFLSTSFVHSLIPLRCIALSDGWMAWVEDAWISAWMYGGCQVSVVRPTEALPIFLVLESRRSFWLLGWSLVSGECMGF